MLLWRCPACGSCYKMPVIEKEMSVTFEKPMCLCGEVKESADGMANIFLTLPLRRFITES